MFQPTCKALALATAFLLASLGARADDTEIFFAQPEEPVRPNILLILDTSGSMNELAGTASYDSSVTYAVGSSGCADTSRIYAVTGSTPPTSCAALTPIAMTDMKCSKTLTALASGSGVTGRAGFDSDRYIRWGGSGNNYRWNNSLTPTNASFIECKSDRNVHGVDAASGSRYPRSGTHNSATALWTNASGSAYSNNNNDYQTRTFYSANYIRYAAATLIAANTRMEIVKNAAANFIEGLPDVNLGVMRYSANSSSYGDQEADASGGMITSAVSRLDDKRAALADSIRTSNLYEPFGYTPLSETLYEAYQYFSGATVRFGASSKICTRVDTSPGTTGACAGSSYLETFLSVPASKSGSNYISPITESCQFNYVVFLTDGLPTQDTEANTTIDGLVDCASGDGACLGALAEHMNNDLGIITHFIGFGSDVAGGAPFEYLESAAERGGGKAYSANLASELNSAFNDIAETMLSVDTTFASPAVTVNAFNRTKSAEDLYVSVFKPTSNLRWPGNVKKYRVAEVDDQDAIVDVAGAVAVDPLTGFFKTGAQSYWSTSADGANTEAGGAASRLPSPTTRDVYTYIGTNPEFAEPQTLSASDDYKLIDTNVAVVAALAIPTGGPSPTDLISWARGVDVLDEDSQPLTTTRKAMGDPVHASPTVVNYVEGDSVIYIATNDGYLHAIDAEDGQELWAFIPQEVLPRLKDLFSNEATDQKHYLLDGEIKVLKYDVDGDGDVEPDDNDRVVLYFGTGRGGSRYYALDVTDKDAPGFMWTISDSELPGLGRAWSPPSVERIRIDGVKQNTQKAVLVIGGGYDPGQDSDVYTTADTVGNRIYFVDAIGGTLLWSAGLTGSGADFEHERMTHSIPSAISVMDTNGDFYADRMYVGDMAAQLWRFDIWNGEDADDLVTGGVLASLGGKPISGADDGAPAAADARRFYNQPDVAYIETDGGYLLNIAIGSGYRGHPLNTATRDRFYSIRDFNPRRRLTQDQYDDEDVVRILSDGDLLDITEDTQAEVTATSPGWRLMLNYPSWEGEKNLNRSITTKNEIKFTTYIPSATASACSVSPGKNRAYTIHALNGAPVRVSVLDEDNDGEYDTDPPQTDRFEDLNQSGIAPQPTVLFPEGQGVVCLSGVEVLGICTQFDTRQKTFWKDSNAY